ncbi:MAG TPA: hypothetical protein PL017_11735 [Tenuifilaceae bacterium]|nr:hypothetical protein [Tenuifilaceae bacterium]HPJ46763.1 hypothetical protein [Tenuifilaceae bacterium]HRX68427.1 hypothetical protein [Tenuifilaceae bacterium]
MKKSTLVFVIAGLVVVSTLAWLIYNFNETSIMENLHFGVILVLLIFAVFVGYKRLSSEKRGEPTEDELSKKLVQKAAALSYFISLYLWVFMIYIKDRVQMDVEVLMGSGILAMGVVFAASWLFFNFRGIRGE